jgi:FkbM family methyltransferase
MKRALINAARSTLSNLGIGAVKAEMLESLVQKGAAYDLWSPRRDFELLASLTAEQRAQAYEVQKISRSQLRQDVFALAQLGFKRNGFFVEFGATNGVDLSNTWLMEKHFGWKGVLAEPARCWHVALAANRTAVIEKRCVWRKSGEVLKFNEVDAAELSTIDSFSQADDNRENRKAGRTYDVGTISLDELLDVHRAPRVVDYLSIDTEGSELEILKSFDFSRRHFSVITCEHNYTSQREEIFDLLSRNGYLRKFQEISEFDDWYVRAT